MVSRDPDPEKEALVEIAKIGDLQEAEILLKQWQDRRTPASLTPQDLSNALGKAISYERMSLVELLLAHGATVNTSHISIAYGRNPEVELALFQTFHKYGWEVNSRTKLRKPAMWHAVCNEPLMRWFLENGAYANFGRVGGTLLDLTAACSTPRVFDLLVAHRARTEDTEALHRAAGQIADYPGRLETTQHLLDLGFDPNAMGRLDYLPFGETGRGTPLHAAMPPRQTDRIDLLLRHGADPEIKNTLGQSPLEYAIARDYKPSVEFLKHYRK